MTDTAPNAVEQAAFDEWARTLHWPPFVGSPGVPSHFEAFRAGAVWAYAAGAADREQAQAAGAAAEEQPMIPRRIDMRRWVTAERAIFDAIQYVEAMPPDERLTRAVVLLQEARGAVADYVDATHDETPT